MRQNREEKRPVIYLDETWANAHDGKDRVWMENDTVTGGTIGGVHRPSGNGKLENKFSSILEAFQVFGVHVCMYGAFCVCK